MIVRVRKGDCVEIENTVGVKRLCVVVKGCDIGKGHNTKEIVLSEVDCSESFTISYPISCLSRISKLDKRKMLFYINKRNKYVMSSLFKKRR